MAKKGKSENFTVRIFAFPSNDKECLVDVTALFEALAKEREIWRYGAKSGEPPGTYSVELMTAHGEVIKAFEKITDFSR